MKRIFLCAYDKQNLGDDLFIHTICNRYLKTKFYLWSDEKNKENFKKIKNLVIVDQKNSPIIRVLKKIRPSLVTRYEQYLKKRAKAIVYIGGSIFMEYENWQATLDWWRYLIGGFPYYAIGCNFGPYKTEAYKEGMANIYADMRDVCFRDKYSYDKFAEVATVRYAPDILFSYPVPSSDTIEKNIFVSVINCQKRGEGSATLSDFDETYLDNLAKLLSGYLQNGYKLTLASFCNVEGDEEAITRLRAKMGVPDTDLRVKNLFYNGRNEEEVLSAMAGAEGIIASRFHAMVLGLVAKRPVLPVVYSDKTLHVLEDVGFTGKVLDLRKGDSITFEEAQENFKTLQLPDVEKLAREAEQHFAKLDEILLYGQDMGIHRFFERAKHFLGRVRSEGKVLFPNWKTFGGKVAWTIFFDGLKPPGKGEKYIATIQSYVDNFLADVIEKHKNLPDESEKVQGKIPVWCCWWQGTEQMPEIAAMCHAKLKQVLPEDKAELHIITLDNYQQYVDIPEHIIDKFNRKIITMTTMSDVLRFRLLEKYGGYWLDATVFFTDNIPDQYFSGNFYCQRMAGTEDARREACKGNWCGFSMAGPAHSPVFRFMNDAFDKWWTHYDRIIEYVLIDYMLMTGFSHVPAVHDVIDAVPNNNREIFALYQRLNEPYSDELYAELTKVNVMHKLTYKMDLKKETEDGRETLYARMLADTYKKGE